MREILFVREAGDLAFATSHLVQSSSASRFTAGASAFFILSQSGGPSVKNCCCSRRITNSRESGSRSSTGGHSNYRSRSRCMDSQICVSRNQPSDECHHRGG